MKNKVIPTLVTPKIIIVNMTLIRVTLSSLKFVYISILPPFIGSLAIYPRSKIARLYFSSG